MSFTTSFAPFKPKSRLQGCEPILTLWSQLTYPLRNFNKHCCHVVIFCLLLLRKNVRNKPPPNPVRLPLIGPWSKVYLSQVFLLSFFDNVGGACKMRTSEGRSAVRVSPLPFRDKRRMRTSQDQTLPGMLSIVLFHSKVQSFNAPFKEENSLWRIPSYLEKKE